MGSTGAVGGAGSATVVSQPEGFDFTKLSESGQLSKVKEMQNAMGQTGDEAGKINVSSSNKLYVNTAKSMCINLYLNTDGATYDSKHTDWGHLISEGWVKDAIKKLDKGMKPLSESVMGYKFVSPEGFSKMTGLEVNEKNIGTLINLMETDKSTQQKTNQLLQNLDYTNKGYTSMTYLPEHGSYDNMPIRLNFVMRKGSGAIVTNNHPEHEIVGARGAKYNFTGARVEENYSKAAHKKIKQLVVDVYI